MMSSLGFYNGFLAAMLVLAAIVFVTLFFIDAGYGQYFQRRWGPAIDNRLGWVLMESPVVILFFLFWIGSCFRC
jgi:3-oxo-5-alpha-steroid 4-dehydrogenase 1